MIEKCKSHRKTQRALRIVMAAVALMLIAAGPRQAMAAEDTDAKTLAHDTRFFVQPPVSGAMQQIKSLLQSGKEKDALLIARMESFASAVWLNGDSPSEAGTLAASTIKVARAQGAVPVFSLVNVPGKYCSGYPSYGASTTAEYEAWIDTIASAIGDNKVVIILEQGQLAQLPSDCGYDPAVVNLVQADADRYAQIQYAVTKLEKGRQTLVYLEAGHSAWQAVGTMAGRLVKAGVLQTEGFFSNIGTNRLTTYETKYDTWISECLAFGTNPADGGWRLGQFEWCASQYYSPLGPVDPNNIATWVYTDEWFQQNLGSARPVTHFVIDTSSNGQGPVDVSVYAKPPFNQSLSVTQALNNGMWCNAVDPGLGLRPSADTGVPLLDAYLWVQQFGQSNSVCSAQNGSRAWDYTAYTQPGWPADAAGQAGFDPLWGLVDPNPGSWFPQRALVLVQQANPPLGEDEGQ